MHRQRICLGRAALVTAVLAASLLPAAPPAHAACHIAGFVDSAVEVGTDAGSVTLTVELQGGQPSCEGTVDWATEDGTATAGTDYEAGSGTLTFVAADDRAEDITIAILDGAAPGDFRVVLANPTGSISGTDGPATVTITGGAEPTEVTEPATGETTAPPADDPTTAAATDEATPVTDAPTTAADEADGASFPWVPLLAVVIVLGLLVAWYIARRTSTHGAD